MLIWPSLSVAVPVRVKFDCSLMVTSSEVVAVGATLATGGGVAGSGVVEVGVLEPPPEPQPPSSSEAKINEASLERAKLGMVCFYPDYKRGSIVESPDFQSATIGCSTIAPILIDFIEIINGIPK